MDKGSYKIGGIKGTTFWAFKNLIAEPDITTIDKLYVIGHDLYYNKNGLNLNLTSGLINYWTKTGTILSPLTPGDSLDLGNGYIKSDIGLKDQYVIEPLKIGEPFGSYDNLSAELISNGDFSGGNTDWTEGADWSIGGGKASITGAGISELSQSVPPLVLTEDTLYVISFEVIDVSLLGGGGVVTPKLLGAVEVIGIPQSTEVAGVYTQSLLATADSLLGLSFECNNASGASIDNISIKSVVSFLTSDFAANSLVGALNELRKAIPSGQELYLALYPSSGSAISDTYTDGTYSLKIKASTPTLTNNIEYTIPAINENADFVMNKGNQSIAGNKTFSNDITVSGVFESGLSNVARLISVATVTGDGSIITVSSVGPHGLSSGDIVIMNGWTGGSGVWDGRYDITYVDDYTFSYLSTGNGSATGGTCQYVIGIDTEIVDVILSKHKCSDIVIENLSASSVTIDIGTTLGGDEISSSLVCAPGITQLFVNQIFDASVDQSIFISSLAWGTEYIDVHIYQTKIMK